MMRAWLFLLLLLSPAISYAGDADIVERLTKGGATVHRYHVSGDSYYTYLVDFPASEDLPELCELHNLDSLTLRGDKLTSKSLRTVATLKKLRRLTLMGISQPDIDIGLQELNGLQGLEELSLVGSQNINGELPKLNDLVVLRDLCLADSDVGNEGVRGLGRLKSLRTLSLSKTRITDDGLQSLVAVKGLKELDICYNNITDVGLSAVGDMRGLTHLELNKTKITDAGLKKLAKLPELSYLNLTSCSGITDSGIDDLARLPALKGVTLTDTRVTVAGDARLQKLLPDCFITHDRF